ncbi:hypothetical protein [Rathayibacter tritici]|uniref:hypothetical protein n=1 Tax=Rathayibacter tritici TaxID=33888 RepID=UPI000831F5E1|nr:hypothetical protein [Rathayibacter tritici]PPF31426.1 hypothetical protein C5C06_01335 [Rathayibacter tritici]PPI14231.1 hypothetical protein C5D07_09250 [Rathayibacter tritici]PPI43458.1 hypothetical protein C5D18_09485 [Rathayibacter tritici]
MTPSNDQATEAEHNLGDFAVLILAIVALLCAIGLTATDSPLVGIAFVVQVLVLVMVGWRTLHVQTRQRRIMWSLATLVMIGIPIWTAAVPLGVLNLMRSDNQQQIVACGRAASADRLHQRIGDVTDQLLPPASMCRTVEGNVYFLTPVSQTVILTVAYVVLHLVVVGLLWISFFGIQIRKHEAHAKDH